MDLNTLSLLLKMERTAERKIIKRDYSKINANKTFLFSDSIFSKNLGSVKKTEFNMINKNMIEKYKDYFRSLHGHSLHFICRELIYQNKYIGDILESGILDKQGCYYPEVMRQMRLPTHFQPLLPSSQTSVSLDDPLS